VLLLILPPEKSHVGRTMVSKQELRGGVKADLWTVIVGTATKGRSCSTFRKLCNVTFRLGDGIV